MSWEEVSSISTALSAIFLIISGLIIFSQLREMKKTNQVEVFSFIVNTLQDEKVRNARDVLMKISEKDFSKWQSDEVKNTEIVCSTYNTAGIMLKQAGIDFSMVSDEWRDSIKNCWEHAKPMLDSYRKSRGSDYWDEFDLLYKSATRVEQCPNCGKEVLNQDAAFCPHCSKPLSMPKKPSTRLTAGILIIVGAVIVVAMGILLYIGGGVRDTGLTICFIGAFMLALSEIQYFKMPPKVMNRIGIVAALLLALGFIIQLIP